MPKAPARFQVILAVLVLMATVVVAINGYPILVMLWLLIAAALIARTQT